MYIEFEKYIFKIIATIPRDEWVNQINNSHES